MEEWGRAERVPVTLSVQRVADKIKKYFEILKFSQFEGTLARKNAHVFFGLIPQKNNE